jgi:hypothetical protein
MSVISGNTVRLLHSRVNLGVVLLSLFNLSLDVAYRRQILVQLSLVGRPEIRLKLAGIVAHEIEDAAPESVSARALLGRQPGIGAE